MLQYLVRCIVLIGMLLAANGAATQDLTGRWYGEGYQGRRYLHHLSERKANGEFSAEFREYDDCKLVAQHAEVGHWSMKDGIYTVLTVLVDGKLARFIDAYTVESADDLVMRYRHTKNGRLYIGRRVGADFEWPACDPSKLVS